MSKNQKVKQRHVVEVSVVVPTHYLQRWEVDVLGTSEEQKRFAEMSQDELEELFRDQGYDLMDDIYNPENCCGDGDDEDVSFSVLDRSYSRYGNSKLAEIEIDAPAIMEVSNV